MKTREKNINTLIETKRQKVDNVNNQNTNRTLIIGFLKSDKIHLMNFNLFQKQEPVFIITKLLNQYLNIKTQTTDEIHSLESYENSSVVLDDILLSKQESDFDLFFTRGRQSNFDIQFLSQSCFHISKDILCTDSNTILFSKGALREIVAFFHDLSGLDMDLEERKLPCRKAWRNDYKYLQIDRFAKIAEGRYTIRNYNLTTYIECTLEKKLIFYK